MKNKRQDKKMTNPQSESYQMVLMSSNNYVQKIRESMMMSKSELARKAHVTVQTIDRIEKGKPCRLDTKRKIILALGYKLGDRGKIFMDEDDEAELGENGAQETNN
jgi:DNA-binding XRE family transcriptional regulator